MTTTPTRQAQKNPLAAGCGGKICASTAGGEIPAAGDFINIAITEQTMMPSHYGTRSPARHYSHVRLSAAFRLGGVA